MNRAHSRIGGALVLATISTSTLYAGGRLETIKITSTPSPIAGHVLAETVGIEWDARTLPVRYRVNDTLPVIPNPLGAGFLTVDQARADLQVSLDAWTAIPTSFVAMGIDGAVSNDGLVGFDMINELSFRTAAGFAAIASSPSTSLIEDVTLVDGDDLDGDGDSDVSGAIATATDVDGDGDTEFPAGFYKAGTILDNDVQFNTKASNGLRFTVDPAAIDTVTRSVDLQTVALHEFGHSFGLAHVLANNKSRTSGRGAVMFPFIDTGDPAAELSGRTLDSDDIAMASLLYPEGTASAGPAALQPGDVRFSSVYGRLTGSVHHGVSTINGAPAPIVGGYVYATDRKTGALVSTGYSGRARLSYNPLNGGLFFVPDPAIALIDGNFEIALPAGSYTVGVEALDGAPAAAGNVSFSAQVGNFFGLLSFNEELWNGNKEGALEKRAGDGLAVQIKAGKTTSGVEIVTNRVLSNLGSFGTRTNIGFINLPVGRYYAVRVPAAAVTQATAAGRFSIHSVLFDTNVVDASVVPLFEEAMLTTGSVTPDGVNATLDLLNPLARVSKFVAADNDFAPMFIKNPHDIGDRVREGIAAGSITDLFLVLRIPTTAPYPGVSGQPPLVSLSPTTPAASQSYLSDDAGIFTRRNDFNFRFSLTLAPWVP
jgi:hypothetical protein